MMQKIDTKASLPLYLQLIDILRTEILQHKLSPHQRMLSEREMVEKFKVSRMTIRQALSRLENEGLIYRQMGKGTFVNEPKIDQQLKTVSGFTREMRDRSVVPSSQVLDAGRRSASFEVAHALQVPQASEVIMLSRLRLANGIPLAIEVVHLPWKLCPELLSHDMSRESLYEILEQHYGFRLALAEQTIESALAEEPELSLLHLSPPSPVLIMTRRTFTDKGIAIEYVNSVYRADRYKFRSRLVLPNETNGLEPI